MNVCTLKQWTCLYLVTVNMSVSCNREQWTCLYFTLQQWTCLYLTLQKWTCLYCAIVNMSVPCNSEHVCTVPCSSEHVCTVPCNSEHVCTLPCKCEHVCTVLCNSKHVCTLPCNSEHVSTLPQWTCLYLAIVNISVHCQREQVCTLAIVNMSVPCHSEHVCTLQQWTCLYLATMNMSVPCKMSETLWAHCHLVLAQQLHTGNETSCRHGDLHQNIHPGWGGPADPWGPRHTQVWFWTSPPCVCWVGTLCPGPSPWSPPPARQSHHSMRPRSPGWKSYQWQCNNVK